MHCELIRFRRRDRQIPGHRHVYEYLQRYRWAHCRGQFEQDCKWLGLDLVPALECQALRSAYSQLAHAVDEWVARLLAGSPSKKICQQESRGYDSECANPLDPRKTAAKVPQAQYEEGLCLQSSVLIDISARSGNCRKLGG